MEKKLDYEECPQCKSKNIAEEKHLHYVCKDCNVNWFHLRYDLGVRIQTLETEVAELKNAIKKLTSPVGE
jgi:Zn finger protein HypA/HybF involved in hydrogenase expression